MRLSMLTIRSRQRGISLLPAGIALALIAVVGIPSSRHVNAQLATQPLDNLVRGYLAAVPGPSRQPDAPSVTVVPSPLKAVYLPGVNVYLQDLRAPGRTSAPAKTDLSGRFTLYAPAPSQYQLCWESRVYGAGCLKGPLEAGRAPQFLSTVLIDVPQKRGLVAMTGRVTAADGSLPRTFDPMLNINSFSTVALEDAQGRRLAEVYVNNFGDYLLPYVPVRQNLRVLALQEGGKGIQDVSSEARLDQSSIHHVNLQLDNHRPFVEHVAAVDTATGKRVQNAPIGGAIKLAARATDKDGDTLEYAWFVGEGQGSLGQRTGAANEWKLPPIPGRYTVTLVVTDNKGGYDKSTLSVLATGRGVPFTGNVINAAGHPITDAEVAIVSDGTVNPILKTDARGAIATTVKQAGRYVVNVRKEGYALNSQIYDRGVTGGRWILRAAQTVTVLPTQDIKLTHKRGERDCLELDSVRAGLGVAGQSLTVAQWQDGRGNVIDSPQAQHAAQPPEPAPGVSGPPQAAAARLASMARRRIEVLKRLVKSDRQKQAVIMPRDLKLPPCGPGVSVFIPANSIVDERGRSVTTPITLSISTVDLLSSQQMPGDGSVVPIGGTGGSYLASFGAGSLDLPKGLRLRTGASADVVIPVDRSRRMGGSLPASVPLLSYDESKGLWFEEGTLTLATVGGVRSYRGKTKHFSTFNADVLFTNNACVRVFSPGLPSSYDLEVTAPHPDGTPHLKKYLIDNTSSTEHVIYNLVPNTNITLAPMTPGPNSHLLGYYVVNSGPVTPFVGTPGAGNAPPGPPYTDCNNFVVLKVGSAPDSPFGGEFLHGLGFIDAANLGGLAGVVDDLTYAAPTGDVLRDALVTASRNYYTTIDPPAALDSFEKFKSVHGFSQIPATPAATEIVASYANSGDLGFGRDMHCIKKNNNDVVCYVTNYGIGYTNIYNQTANGGPGTIDTDDANAAASRSTVGASTDVATVAMEYSDLPNAPGNKVVKFYVYKAALTTPTAVTGTNPTGAYARSISANLDGRGERPVPQLCMICHGGQVPQQSGGVPAFGSNAQVSLGSRFLPFDLRFFTPPSGANPNITAQEPAFKSLNEQIVNAAPPAGSSDPVNEVVAGLYNNGLSSTQIRDFSVPGWQTGASSNVAGQSNFYQRVVADACRTCHIAQPFAQLQFNTAQKFLHLLNPPAPVSANNFLLLGTAQNRVCGDYVMPHAFRTHEIFWGKYGDIGNLQSPPSVSLPGEFQTFGNGIPAPPAQWSTSLCTSFLSTSITSPSVFYGQSIQPIWSGKCTACHVGAFKPLTTGASYNTLNSLALITPGDDSVAANVLLQRTTASNPNNRMPPRCFRAPETAGSTVNAVVLDNIPCLTQLDLNKIKAWLRSGAN
jgi:hypothetical protein